MHRVFVYGTLKTGEPNHSLLAERCKGYAKCLGKALTTQKFPLIIGTKYNIPFMLYSPGVGNIVQGEIYEVDRTTLDRLDELEGHPEYYVRQMDKFILQQSDGGESQVECWVYYLHDFPQSALNKPYYSNYSSYGDHKLPYMERSKRDSDTTSNTKQLLFDEEKNINS